MRRLLLFALLALVLGSASPSLHVGNAILKRCVNAALHEMLSQYDKDATFSGIFHKYFPSTPYSYPKSGSNCSIGATWPPREDLQQGIMKEIMLRGYLLVGAMVPDPPDRVNCAFVPGQTKYQTCEGYDVDVVNALAKRISDHYQFSKTLKAYWVAQRWYTSKQDNIIANLNNGNYDLIVASMSINGQWKNPANESEKIPRTQLIDFSCPYQNGGEAAVRGNRALPAGAQPLDSAARMNQMGIIICVQHGTTMENWARANCPMATVNATTDGTKVEEWTRMGLCHCYIAPAMSAAWDVKTHSELHFVALTPGEADPYGIGIRKDSGAGRLSLGIVALVISLLLSL
eukprot:gnl/Trimastix_PCT/2606.p1 GENE.gnl/Trimastix_PCT/2606~~gnl/Trimastix_PCT/2606.p1  ORF type:complete len:345 (+),score=92.85 gnl/Trimastix_PCT/2606:60-1094(+)